MKRFFKTAVLCLLFCAGGSVYSQRMLSTRPVTFIPISGGVFDMGDVLADELSDEERPVHRVELSSFWISACEITNGQYSVFLNDQGNKFEAGDYWIQLTHRDCLIEKRLGRYTPKAGYRDYPVVAVTWHGARAFADWLGGRLPTEAEWEYAARNRGAPVRYTNGQQLSSDYSNVYGTDGRDIWHTVSPAGSLSPGSLGLYDMIGNVWEYCLDWYAQDYYARSPGKDPRGPFEGTLKIIRGGSWKYARWNSRNMTRGRIAPAQGANDVGFRVVMADGDILLPESLTNSPLFLREQQE